MTNKESNYQVPNYMGKKIAFFDRDGVINRKAPDHRYITRINDFHFNQGILELFQLLKGGGYEFIILTNQRGIARKMLEESDLQAIHEHMQKGLAEKDVQLLDIFYCPHEKDTCDCRKPLPGLIHQAMDKYDIDLSSSILITDSENEVAMGEKLGIRSYLVPVDRPEVIIDKIKVHIKK